MATIDRKSNLTTPVIPGTHIKSNPSGRSSPLPKSRPVSMQKVVVTNAPLQASHGMQSSESKSKQTQAAAAASSSSAVDQVRELTMADYKAAAASLADAFREDEVASYFVDVPDAAHWTKEEKWDLHVSILEYIVAAHIMNGLVLSVGENHAGVALWMPPGQNMDDYWTIFRSGMWRLYYRLTKEGRERYFNEFFPLLHDAKQEVMGDRDDKSWYLVYIGTASWGRGKGLSRKLVEYVTKKADAEGLACYLESSHAHNLKIYNKYGFDFKKQIQLTRGEKPIAMDLMVREPKPSKSA